MNDRAIEIYALQDDEYYVRNHDVIAKVIQIIRNGHYCSVLGPPYCHKSELLKDVRNYLKTEGYEIVIFENLQNIRSKSDTGFLNEFASKVEMLILEQAGVASPFLVSEVCDEHSLRIFLQQYVDILECDLILILDQLEKIRSGPLNSLLRVFRAVYNSRRPDTINRLVVVTASSLTAARLTLGDTSPFNIAYVEHVHDLTFSESQELIRFMLEHNQYQITRHALNYLIEITHGNRHLLPMLCGHSIKLSQHIHNHRIIKQIVKKAVQWFQKEQAPTYLPLRETIREIEADPDVLMNVVNILKSGRVPRRELENLALIGEIDDLQRTGAVRVEWHKGEYFYEIRNEVYRSYLESYFDPDRIVRLLNLAGRWDQAIPFLETLVRDDKKYRSNLLTALINSIYASTDMYQGCKNIACSLSHAFSISSIRIYLSTPSHSEFELISQFGDGTLGDLPPGKNHQVDTNGYVEPAYTVTQTSSGDIVLIIPLISGGSGSIEWEKTNPLGKVVIEGFDADPQSETFLELLAFLEPLGKAIASVVERDAKLTQFEILHLTGKQVSSSLDIKQVQEFTVQAAITAVPAAQKGSLFLWDENIQRLVIKTQIGFQSDIPEILQLREDEGYAGWVFSNREPVQIENVHRDYRTVESDHPEVQQEKSAICVPLEAWGHVIGVLCLDNVTTYNAFTKSDLEVLDIFGSQAAIAIHNARLHTELYNLGMKINEGELNTKQIFEHTIKTIMKVSAIKAANMLWFKDTNSPESSIFQKPLESVSIGLGTDYDEKVWPRSDGLTIRMLKSASPHPLAVCHPDDSPGINPLALEWGTRAYLCLPLVVQDTVKGVVFVHYDQPHEFSDNEKETLSLFTNQAALSIENARQREELAIFEPVSWMGIVFSARAHQIKQKTAAIQDIAFGLSKIIGEEPKSKEKVDQIKGNALTVANIIDAMRALSFERLTQFDLNELLEQEIPQWLSPDDKLVFELANDNTVVQAARERLALALEILTVNASQAMVDEEEKNLIVTSSVSADRVVVSMTNSREVPESIRDFLFNKRIPKTPGERGLGIGALIARYILTHYRGNIALINSAPGTTTISFWLPLSAVGSA